MKIFTLLMCLFSLNAFANWQMEVAFGVDGETWKIDHAKFVEAKETELSFGNYVVKMTVKKGTTEDKGLDVSYSINEKKGEKLTLISKGEDGEDNAVPDLSLTDQLDESQKKLLELRYLEEWSFEEMAKEFKVNAATIRKRISRLLKQLRGAT